MHHSLLACAKPQQNGSHEGCLLVGGIQQSQVAAIMHLHTTAVTVTGNINSRCIGCAGRWHCWWQCSLLCCLC